MSIAYIVFPMWLGKNTEKIWDFLEENVIES